MEIDCLVHKSRSPGKCRDLAGLPGMMGCHAHTPSCNDHAHCERVLDFSARALPSKNQLGAQRRQERSMALSLLMEARSDQHDTKSQSAAASKWRDRIIPVFRGLQFQVPYPGDLPCFLCCENRDRQGQQPQENQHRPADHQPGSSGPSHEDLHRWHAIRRLNSWRWSRAKLCIGNS